MDFLTVLLSALTLHRLWSYDTPLKDKFKNKPFSCPACMAFWCGAAAVLLWITTPPAVSMAFAAYFPLRVWLWHTTKPTPVPVFASSTSTTTSKAPVIATQTVSVPAVITVPPTQKTVVILTALSDFRPSYSVATAVLDNALAIAMARPNWQVEVWTMQHCDPRGWDNMPVNVKHRAIIPHMPWVENVTDETKAQQLAAFLQENLPPWEDSVIITHDLMFVSWYTLFAHAIHLIGAKYWRWFHVPHSLSGDRTGRPEWITTLPAGNPAHHVVTVARGMEQRFADYYQIPRERVHRIANAKDPRSWGTMTPRVRQIVTQTKLWSYDVVQVLPICTTRLEAKGFSKVVRTFALLNQSYAHAFLLVVNPNAGGPRSEAIIKEAKEKAAALGLAPDKWAFTSDLAQDSIPYGLSSDEVNSLWMHYGDVFVFPSMSEADSLVLREAQLCRQVIVGNADVVTLAQAEDSTVAVHWGVGEFTADSEAVCKDVASQIKFLCGDDTPRKRVLRMRNLETIGAQWALLLNNP